MANQRKRTIKQGSTAAAAGGGLGGAVSQVIVHFFPSMEGIEGPLAFILTVLFGLLSAYLVPPSKDEEVEETTEMLELDYDEEYVPGKHAGEHEEDLVLGE